MRISSNLSVMTQYARAIERLSSGLRINRAGDDAAGLAISEKMGGQVRGLDTASRNAWDSISMIRTGEGALEQTHSVLHRMRELSVQASNGTYTDSDRHALQAEMTELKAEINRIGNATEFNTKALLNGGGSFMSQIGANAGQTAQTSLGDMRAVALGVADIDISTGAGAAAAIDTLDAAIQSVSSQRGAFGASENRFGHTINNLNAASANQLSARSRIRDADMARETINRTANDILRQTSMAMISQANMASQNILRLLG